jgi:ABC-type sugar transport system ATPase subunit
MAEVEIIELSRQFSSGGGVNAISLEIGQGELFVLLGPSGSGKSTLLRLIAGLESAEQGRVLIGGAGGDRREAVAMVFQNFALYPHMTAFDNIAFPLRLRRLARREIARRVKQAAAVASLDVDLARLPGSLSGGERQRVALARALVREPRVILMDEPLSSLDAQLRNRLRAELKDFQRRTALTMIYVTHDQFEALTLADRMAVMRNGHIEQVGTPAEVYANPANSFVATFVGQPPMSLLHGRIGYSAEAGHHPMTILDDGQTIDAVPSEIAARREIDLGIRPEDLSLEPRRDGVSLTVTLQRSEFIGGAFLVYALAGSQPLSALLRHAPTGPRATLHAPRGALHFFDALTQRRLA